MKGSINTHHLILSIFLYLNDKGANLLYKFGSFKTPLKEREG